MNLLESYTVIDEDRVEGGLQQHNRSVQWPIALAVVAFPSSVPKRATAWS